jgi:hypothetical protein
VPFPSPPWVLHGQMWLSIFPVRSSGRPDRPAGLYVAAFVDYQPGSVLTYREVLVARLTRSRAVPRIRVTDVWVDSEASRDGGRSLWAIPKELAVLAIDDRRGRVARTTFSGTSIASAAFTAVPSAAVRTRFAVTTSQPRDDGSVTETRMSGSAKTLPCKGSWDFDAAGPLGWMHGRRPVLSLRLTDMRLTFGA